MIFLRRDAKSVEGASRAKEAMGETIISKTKKTGKNKTAEPAKREKRKKAPARNHTQIAEACEADALAGRFPCSRIFRAAIERQRRDLDSPPDGFVFRAELGDKVCRLMELIPFGGEGPKRGAPLRLEPWEVWLVRTLSRTTPIPAPSLT